MTVISVENVTKRYTVKDETVTAVDNLTLGVKEGDTVAILGPSGSGKTTLLRMIAGLESPDSGIIKHDDTPIDAIPKQNRGIGMVFQNYALIPQWNVERNIGFYLRLRQRQREVPQRVHDISKITGVGVEDLMGKFPRQLSGGEKQRVAIARAFARDLRLLLFDEPFANLDAKFRSNARIEARRLLTRYPVTLIYITHDQVEAATMAEKIIVMRDGHIEQIGDYDSLYENPNNRFIAEFVGTPTINLFEGTVQNEMWHGRTFSAIPTPQPIADGTPLTLGIRPHDLIAGGDVRGIIKQVTPFFSERYQLLDVEAEGETWQLQIPLDDVVNIGDSIGCTLPAERALFFYADTGERVG